MYDLIIRDATIVSSAGRQVADVAIRGDKIAYVGPRPPRSARSELSAMGRFLIPGVVDGGLQLSGAGPLARAVADETRAAVTGGVTTVVALPHPERPVRTATDARDMWQEAGRESFCDVGWWANDEHGSIDAIRDAAADGWVAGVLATLHEPDISEERLERWRSFPGLLAICWEAADPPPQRLLDVAKDRERPLHLYALTTATELDWLDPVRSSVSLTAMVTVPHLFLSADDPESADVVTAPPLRPEQDRRTLWTAIKRGRLDTVASHHHAHPDQGVASSELLLPLMLHAAQSGRLSLEQLVGLCCETPARLFGLTTKGRVQKGADADLVLFSEGHTQRIIADHLATRSASPYLGREAAPKPEMVFVAGQLVAERGQLVVDRPVGRALSLDDAA
ncbi:MAG: dihydroorotase family protein [Myxococcota bacterium]